MRFSLKHLLGWTAAAAVACTILFGLPSAIGAAIHCLGLPWLPIILISGIVYARDRRRAFFIGATIGSSPILAPLMLYMFMAIGLVSEISEFSFDDFSQEGLENEAAIAIKFSVAVLYAYIAFCGGVAVLTRWLVSPPATASAIESTAALLVGDEAGRATERTAGVGPPAPHVRIAETPVETGVALNDA